METNQDFQRPQQRVRKKGKGKCCLLGFIMLLIVLIILIGFFLYIFSLAKKIEKGEIDTGQLPKTTKNIDFTNFNLILPDPYKGPPQAEVVIEEYADFECPACLAAYPVVKELTQKYQDRVKFVYKDFPILSLHPNSVNAAMAGQCAHEQEKFWPMHDKIFSNQKDLAVADLKRYAVELGLNSVEFGACLDSNKYFESVEADFNEGIDRGVDSTPTFFINNKILKGAVSLEVFEQIIQKELGITN